MLEEVEKIRKIKKLERFIINKTIIIILRVIKRIQWLICN